MRDYKERKTLSTKAPRQSQVKKLATKSGKNSPEIDRQAIPNSLISEIQALLESADNGLTRRQIQGRLALSQAQKPLIAQTLAAMMEKGSLVQGVGRRYHRPSAQPESDSEEGRVFAHPDGFGFVQTEQDDDLFLSPYQMRQVYHGDRVRCFRRPGRGGRSEGIIDAVLARSFDRMLVRLARTGKAWWGEPLAKNLTHSVRIIDANGLHFEKGRVIEVEMVTYPTLKESATARALKEGTGDRLSDQIRAVAESESIPLAFSEEVERSAIALAPPERPEKGGKRRNLERLPFVTIDGEDARDFDDAIYVKRSATGFKLLVAIADVAHYVTPGSLIEGAAIERGTSVYFPGTVLPMLPAHLCNDLCSLRPDERRFALVCELQFDTKGKRTGFTFYEASIRSKARLIYEAVALHLSGESRLDVPRSVVESLDAASDLLALLLKTRAARGALEIETPEARIVVDASGEPIDQRLNPRTEAHRLIEECMLAANVAAADYLASADMGGIYRVHGSPTPEKLVSLNGALSWFGLPEIPVAEIVEADAFQTVLNEVAATDDAPILMPLVLRSMQQALYSAIEAPHFGLAYERYAHFTSPIRRLPDLINHRLIKEAMGSTHKNVIDDKGPQNDTLKTSTAIDDPAASQLMLEGLASKASETERRADKASQDINQFLRCQYLTDCLGEIYEGRVAHVSKLGAFVLLDELAVEGLIPFRAIRDQLGRLSVLPFALVSDATGKRLSMGDEVTVQLSRVDEKLGHIEFELVEQTTSRSTHPSRPRRPRPSVVEKAGKRRRGPQSKRPYKKGRTEVSQDGPKRRDEKTDGKKNAPRKSRAKQSQAAQRPARRSEARQGKTSQPNSRVVEQGVTKKTDAKKRRSKQSADNSVKAAKRSTPKGSTPKGSTPKGSTPKGSTPKGSTPKGSTPKGKGEPLAAGRSSTRKPFKRQVSKGKIE